MDQHESFMQAQLNSVLMSQDRTMTKYFRPMSVALKDDNEESKERMGATVPGLKRAATKNHKESEIQIETEDRKMSTQTDDYD